MLVRSACLAAIALASCSPQLYAEEAATKEKEKTLPAALNFDMKTLEGKDVNLAEKYAGRVVLLVNVASRCGLTPQYGALQALHEKYADRGLAIVGVPCNQFGGQEPGTAEQIQSFCQRNYGVEFDMLAKVRVKSDQPNQSPLYKFLTSEETNPDHAGNIRWNFEKFLFSPAGEVAMRFGPPVRPDSEEVVQAIERLLADVDTAALAAAE
ncbi:MAG: glutathione peroxidase [Planctomycetota bacterium]